MPIVAIRTLADLRVSIQTGTVNVAKMSTANLYLDLAEGLLGAEFACGNHVESIEAFEKRFPTEFNASIIPGFDDDVLYRKWRSFILKLLRLAGHAKGVDPVSHLNIFAKRERMLDQGSTAAVDLVLFCHALSWQRSSHCHWPGNEKIG